MPSLVTDALLQALGQVESGQNPQAVGDQGKAIGAYQMWPIAYREVQQFFPKEFGKIPYARLTTDALLQRRAAKAYLQVGEQKYGITDLTRLISFYNAGPQARRGPLINQPYVNKVTQLLPSTGGPMSPKTPGPQSAVPQEDGDPIERGLRHINTLTVAAGFGLLSAKDIERILTQVEPPTPVSGLRVRQEKARRPLEAAPTGLQGLPGRGSV